MSEQGKVCVRSQFEIEDVEGNVILVKISEEGSLCLEQDNEILLISTEAAEALADAIVTVAGEAA